MNHSSVSESEDAEFFEYVFPLKEHDSPTAHETVPMHNNVPLSTSSSRVRISADESSKSKGTLVESSFGPNFLTNFLIEDFLNNFLSNELISAFFLEEDLKTYEDGTRCIDVSFWKEAIKSELDSIVSNKI